MTLVSAAPRSGGRPSLSGPTSASGSVHALAAAPTAVQAVTDVRAFHWSYNTYAAGPYAHVAPVTLDGVLQLTMTSHFLDQARLDGFLEDVHAMLAEST